MIGRSEYSLVVYVSGERYRVHFIQVEPTLHQIIRDINLSFRVTIHDNQVHHTGLDRDEILLYKGNTLVDTINLVDEPQNEFLVYTGQGWELEFQGVKREQSEYILACPSLTLTLDDQC